MAVFAERPVDPAEAPSGATLSEGSIGSEVGNVLPAARANIWNSPGTAEAYAGFCQAEWYSDILNTMVSMLPKVAAGGTVLDLGSGTGTGTRALSVALGEDVKVVGIDPALSQVMYAQEQLCGTRGVTFLEGELRTLHQIVTAPVSGMVAFNSIHLMGKFRDVLEHCAPLIEPQGLLAFCSGYSTRRYEGDIGNAARRGLERIILNAAERFPEQMAATSLREILVPNAESGITTVRSNILEKNLSNAGFSVERHEYHSSLLPLESIVDFLVLPGVGDSVLPETIPLSERRALITETLQSEGVTVLPRNWCYVVARKIEQ